MAIQINVLGAASGNTGGGPSDATHYDYLPDDPSAGAVIYSSDFTPIAAAVNAESQRRGKGNPGLAAPTVGATVTAAYVNSLWSGLVNAGYSNSSLFNGVSTGSIITADAINNLIKLIQDAAAVCLCNCNYCTCNCNYCTCNCNYCTCNCNYCTCNCNYACTCNCNYSDERLKTNIQFVEVKEEVNVYTWNYVWDLTSTYEGVIAQQLVDTKFDNALSKDANGYYMVDYSKLPVDMIKR